ncbi:MAG: hypothetical protein ACRES7_03205 [Gammaproteobacteria bacterium]
MPAARSVDAWQMPHHALDPAIAETALPSNATSPVPAATGKDQSPNSLLGAGVGGF